ncbi:MAG: hypothetical protein KBA60_12610 [Flavobacteriales bacterium]|nr:hypothetical protein [Flavobacteriales bacterium]MBP6642673.1 hypothetical protein [Flavobacteriales bacterium]MBP7156847.1 hypothetical protein [Flavobacteriales bacterium]HQV75706.1 hypothetical protein [Flavobacteriales bacterium]HQW41413.1 hypothetical protein [Flavobacteriales bacterium]
MLPEHKHPHNARSPNENVGEPQTISLRAVLFFALVAVGLAGLLHHAISGKGGLPGLRSSTDHTVQQ